MLAFVVRRLLWAGLLGVVITLITFILFFVVPGERQSGTGQHGLIEPTLQAQFDLRGSWPMQYLQFLQHVFLQGDLGVSRISGTPVAEVVAQALPVTVSLVVGGTILWLLLAFPIGIISALRPRSVLDKSLMLLVLAGLSAHPVWIGLMLSYFLGVKAHLLPVAGYCNFLRPEGSILCGGPRFWAQHMVMPWITFALLFAALYARMIRASVLEALDEDYVRTARAKGAGAWRIMRRHVLRNALLPVIAMLGMDVGVAFAGALFIETVFTLPGIGRLLFTSIAADDLPVVMGIVLFISFAVAVATLIADLALAAADPRVAGRGSRQRSRLGRVAVERVGGKLLRRRPEPGTPRALEL